MSFQDMVSGCFVCKLSIYIGSYVCEGDVKYMIELGMYIISRSTESAIRAGARGLKYIIPITSLLLLHNVCHSLPSTIIHTIINYSYQTLSFT